MLIIKERFEAKLTVNEIKEIRKEYSRDKISQQQLAEKYNITQANISLIVRRVTWQHV